MRIDKDINWAYLRLSGAINKLMDSESEDAYELYQILAKARDEFDAYISSHLQQ